MCLYLKGDVVPVTMLCFLFHSLLDKKKTEGTHSYNLN